MCEIMGSEPLDSEMPCEREDLADETQFIFALYDKLPARWEGFSGQYLGKELGLLKDLFEVYNLQEYQKLYAWEIIPIIDSIIASDIAQKIKSKSKSKGSGDS